MYRKSCIVCSWHSHCMNFYAARRSSFSGGLYQHCHSKEFSLCSTRAIPKMTARRGVLAWFIFLVDCMCLLACWLSSTITDYEIVSSGINLWKLHLMWSYFRQISITGLRIIFKKITKFIGSRINYNLQLLESQMLDINLYLLIN